MCLRKITKRVPWNKKPSGEIWYKLVKKYRDSDGTIFYRPFYQTSSGRLQLFKIYNDKSKRTIETQYDRTKHKYYHYKSGFHFYDAEIIETAKDWHSWGTAHSYKKGPSFLYGTAVLQCAVWNIQTYGEDTYGNSCVAKSFMPIAEVE